MLHDQVELKFPPYDGTLYKGNVLISFMHGIRISVVHWDPILGSQLGIWDGIWDPNVGSQRWDGIFGPFSLVTRPLLFGGQLRR